MLVLLAPAPATAAPALAVPCAVVKAQVARFRATEAELIAWARRAGYDEATIRAARACLRKP